MGSFNKTKIESLETRIVFATDGLEAFVPRAAAPESENVRAASVEALAESWSAEAWSNDIGFAHDQYALYGHGQTVAIIDSGIAYDHPALGAGFGTSHRVVGGWDFAENDGNPYDDGPMGFHGTHVAGIVGSSNDAHAGVASEVDLVALRVFDDEGYGESQWITDALWWVHDHRLDFEHPITTVNLSLAIDDSDPAWLANVESALEALHQDGIFVSVSAGNSFDGDTTLKNPANSEFVIPVASVGDDGALSEFSQRNSRIIAAPGEFVTSTVPDYLYGFDGVTDDYAAASGTSMAAPHIAGASVLLREAFDHLGEAHTPTALYNHLYETSDVIYDPVTSAHYRRMNLSAALEAAIGDDEAGETVDSALSVGTISDSLAFSGVINQVDDADVYSFVALTSGTVEITREWSADSSSPEMFIENATALSDREFRVEAGNTYHLVVDEADSIGRYDASLRLTPELRTIATAPSIESKETSYGWTASQDGWYEIEVLLEATSSSDQIRVLDGNGQLAYASSQMFAAHRVQLFVSAGETVEIALTGLNPRATFSVASLEFTGSSGGQGGPQSLAGPGETDSFAAFVFSDPDEVHQLAWAPKKTIDFVDVGVTRDAEFVAPQPVDRPWLAAMVGRQDSSDSTSDADRAHAEGLASFLFAMPGELPDELYE